MSFSRATTNTPMEIEEEQSCDGSSQEEEEEEEQQQQRENIIPSRHTTPSLERVTRNVSPRFYEQFEITSNDKLSEDQLVQLYSSVWRKWKSPTDRRDFLDWANRQFGFDPNKPVEFVIMYETYRKEISKLILLYYHLETNKLIGIDNETMLRNKNHFSKIFDLVTFSYYAMEGQRRCMNAVSPKVDNYIPAEMALFRYKLMDTSQNTPYQNLIMYVLSRLFEFGYKRYKETCYVQVVSEVEQDGFIIPYETHAWKYACEIRQFIYQICDMHTHYQQWHNLTASKGNAKELDTHLKYCADPQFENLVMDRHIFSFKNGIYDAQKGEFYPFNLQLPIPKSLVACNYFPLDFPHHLKDVTDWYHDIPTPHFQSVMDYQEMGSEETISDHDHQSMPERESVYRWMYILYGRLMYDIGEHDGWQVAPCIKGVAGTGKSTFADQASYLYDGADVAVLSSNAEEKFGLSSIVDKFLFVCRELKEKFGISQGDLQSIITGEGTSIAIKFKTAFTKRWITPGIFMGNETPSWIDTQGNMSRRIVLFEFLKKVMNVDHSLGKKLQEEFANFLLKCNIAYRKTAQHHGKKDIWSLLPPYFQKTKDRLRCQINSLFGFMSQSEKFVYDPTNSRYIYMKQFVDEYNAWVRERKFNRVRFNADLYEPIFAEFRVKVQKRQLPWSVNGAVNTIYGDFLIGVGYTTGYPDTMNIPNPTDDAVPI